MRRAGSSGQSLTEYAVVLTVVIMAFVGMQLYVKRGLQARHRGGVQHIFSDIRQETGKADITSQYDPYYLDSSITENRTSDVTVGVPSGSIDQTVNRTGWQRVGPAEDE